MSEILGNRYEGQENRNNENISVFDSGKYQTEIQSFYMKNKDNPQTIQTLKDFVDKQEQDKKDIRENLEKPLLQETREGLDKQAMINEAKTMLYEKIGIDNNQNNNSSLENFTKGVIDGGIIDNYDLAIQVYETNGKIILDGLEQLLSWEGLKNLANAIGEDIGTLFTGNAYEKGKVSAEVVLALLTAGAGLTINVAKKGVKLGIKELSKLRANKERLVENPEVKSVINETNTKLDEIVPKKETDLDKIAQKSFDIERQVKGLEELGIPESFSRDLLESGILTPLLGKGEFNLLKRYKNFNRDGIDYELMINKTKEKIPDLSKKEALLIFSYTDFSLYGKLNSFMRGDKELISGMTKGNIEATNKIITDLKKALEKMPDMEGKLVYRGDDWIGYNGNIGDEIDLKSFSSVFNTSNDAFISKDRNILLVIEGKKGRVKDISPLAIGVNFGDKLKGISKTNNEGVILPNSVIKIVGKTTTNEPGYLLNKIRYQQIK